MPVEPHRKRTIAFFDGQNLFNAAKTCFGYSFPNYDPKALAHEICDRHGWDLLQTRFYTGIPDDESDPRHHFWVAKLANLGRQRVFTFSRPTRHGHEKGIDVRLALDVVGLAFDGAYDIGLIFSQDQDLAEVKPDVRRISIRDKRWIKLASAFPVSAHSLNTRGINGMDWIPIDRSVYDACLDQRDYRQSRSR